MVFQSVVQMTNHLNFGAFPFHIKLTENIVFTQLKKGLIREGEIR